MLERRRRPALRQPLHLAVHRRLAETTSTRRARRRWRYVKFLFEPRPWYNLIPDQTHTVVTAGYGTFADSGALGDNDYLTAARTPDGALVMAYMPTVRTITVDMTKLGAAAYASWYDPSDGTFTPIAGSPFANTRHAQLHAAGQQRRRRRRLGARARSDGGAARHRAAVGADRAVGATGDRATADRPRVDGVDRQRRRRRLSRLPRRRRSSSTTPSTSYADTGLSPLDRVRVHRRRLRLRRTTSRRRRRRSSSTTAARARRSSSRATPTPQSPQSVVARDLRRRADRRRHQHRRDRLERHDARSITSVIDSAGNVYQPAIADLPRQRPEPGDLLRREHRGRGAGANQVTVTFDQPAVFVDLRITEYSRPPRQRSPFDAGASATRQRQQRQHAATLTTSAASELLFAAGMTERRLHRAGRRLHEPRHHVARRRPRRGRGRGVAGQPRRHRVAQRRHVAAAARRVQAWTLAGGGSARVAHRFSPTERSTHVSRMCGSSASGARRTWEACGALWLIQDSELGVRSPRHRSAAFCDGHHRETRTVEGSSAGPTEPERAYGASAGERRLMPDWRVERRMALIRRSARRARLSGLRS